MKSIMKVLEKGKADEAAEVKKIADLNGKKYSKFIIFWIVIIIIIIIIIIVMVKIKAKNWSEFNIKFDLTFDIILLIIYNYFFNSTGKVAAAEVVEAKAGDAIKAMETLVNEAKTKLSNTVKGK